MTRRPWRRLLPAWRGHEHSAGSRARPPGCSSGGRGAAAARGGPSARRLCRQPQCRRQCRYPAHHRHYTASAGRGRVRRRVPARPPTRTSAGILPLTGQEVPGGWAYHRRGQRPLFKEASQAEHGALDLAQAQDELKQEISRIEAGGRRLAAEIREQIHDMERQNARDCAARLGLCPEQRVGVSFAHGAGGADRASAWRGDRADYL